MTKPLIETEIKRLRGIWENSTPEEIMEALLKCRLECEKRIDERIRHIAEVYPTNDVLVLNGEHKLIKQIIKEIYG